MVGLVQLLSVRIREELEEEVLEGILEVVGLVVEGPVVGMGVGRCDICTDWGIQLLGLMRIDLLFKERELLWIGWNMERDMFDCCVFPTFFVRMKVIKVLHFTLSFYQTFSTTVYCEGLYRLLYASGGLFKSFINIIAALLVLLSVGD